MNVSYQTRIALFFFQFQLIFVAFRASILRIKWIFMCIDINIHGIELSNVEIPAFFSRFSETPRVAVSCYVLNATTLIVWLRLWSGRRYVSQNMRAAGMPGMSLEWRMERNLSRRSLSMFQSCVALGGSRACCISLWGERWVVALVEIRDFHFLSSSRPLFVALWHTHTHPYFLHMANMLAWYQYMHIYTI